MEDENWKFDDVAKYSYTKLCIAEEFAKKIKFKYPDVKTIYDACACVGGNTIGFSKNGFDVYATEIDPVRYNMLCSNIKVSGVSNIKHKCDDCFKYFAHIDADLIFIDAPWEGGKDYKNLKKFNMDSLIFNDNKTIIDALKIIKLNKNVKYVVLKVPNRFYEPNFEAYWWKFRNHKYCLIDILNYK